MQITLSLVILVLTLIANLVIAVFVYKNNPKSATNRTFGVLGILISLWLVVLLLTQNTLDHQTYLFWARMSIVIAAPMSMMFFLLAHTLPNLQLRIRKSLFWLMIGITLVVMFINISPFTFTDIQIVNGAPNPVTGPGMIPFGILSTFFSAGSVFLLFKKSIYSKGKEKEQFKYMTIGILLMLGLIIGTIFVPVIIYNNTSFVPFAPLYTVLFLGLTAYVIIRHRFLDIRLILGRAIAFLVFILLCAATYVFVIFFGVENIFKIQIDSFLKIIAFSLAVLTALTFQPLLSWLHSITNRIFFKGSFESDKLMSDLTKIMAQTIDLDMMTSEILKLLNQEMRLSKSAFLLIMSNEIVDAAVLNYRKNELLSARMQEFFMKFLRSKFYVFEEMSESKLKNFFRSMDISVSIPIQVDRQNVAVLLLGQKLSGEV